MHLPADGELCLIRGGPSASAQSAGLYEHALRAVLHGLRFGEHGLPLMGGGDWNDGMNLVGRGGNGESVWLGFYSVAVALGWGFGSLYVRRTWGLPTPVRRRFLLIYYLGPPAILGVLRSMAPWPDQRAAPFVPLYAFGVFSILFLVPVTMRFPRPMG